MTKFHDSLLCLSIDTVIAHHWPLFMISDVNLWSPSPILIISCLSWNGRSLLSTNHFFLQTPIPLHPNIPKTLNAIRICWLERVWDARGNRETCWARLQGLVWLLRFGLVLMIHGFGFTGKEGREAEEESEDLKSIKFVSFSTVDS